LLAQRDLHSRRWRFRLIPITSIGPVLFIVIAIGGFAFGEDAARGAIASQLSELTGRANADLVQTAVQSAAGKSSGILASVLGATTLLITASLISADAPSEAPTCGGWSPIRSRTPPPPV
jgi:hypothetical protein